MGKGGQLSPPGGSGGAWKENTTMRPGIVSTGELHLVGTLEVGDSLIVTIQQNFSPLGKYHPHDSAC